jgi:hypothetical protein
MSENLTKRGSAPGPAGEYRARGGFDDLVHLVLAAPVDLVDPSALRTDCGAAVLEVYTDHRPVTCSHCQPRRAQGSE